MAFAPPLYIIHKQGGRAAVYAELRRRGEGERLDLLLALLASHQTALNETIRLADRWPADLNMIGLRKRAALFLHHISWALDCPDLGSGGHLGEWGENGAAPSIRDLLAGARWHDARRVEMQRAAA